MVSSWSYCFHSTFDSFIPHPFIKGWKVYTLMAQKGVEYKRDGQFGGMGGMIWAFPWAWHTSQEDKLAEKCIKVYCESLILEKSGYFHPSLE